MEDYLLLTASAGVGYLFWEKFMKKEEETEEFEQLGGGEGQKLDTAIDPNLQLREGGIDLTNINCGAWDKTPKGAIELKSTKEEMKTFPCYKDFNEALEASPTKGFHLVVPGLLPAPNSSWTEGKPEDIWLMPNDSKPHHHGDAPHHLVDWDISEVFEMVDLKYHSVKNKKIKKYREKKEIQNFYEGNENSAIETWINWRIPYDEKDYPVLIVNKYSIIWWDFYNTHNLALVDNEDNYTSNNFENSEIIYENDSTEGSHTLVTVMNKRGNFYFACTKKGHAELGHKIIIRVV